MCEITCENFYSELPAIEAALEKSAFISLDMEFSKLYENISKPFTFFDTPEERYTQLRQKVSDITCIQLGLAVFIYDTKNQIFKACTYSFYTYPQTFYKSESVVNFQTSCVEFLCKHKFDFNKLFHHRVSYLTDEQELEIKSQMLDPLFFDKYFETNFKFRSIEEELINILKIVSEWYNNATYGDQTFMEINGCDEPAYIILLQYYLIKKLKYIIIHESQLGLNVTKIQENENSETWNNEIFENLKINLFNKMMGIKYVINLISKLKKPLIGHNFSLDFLILCNQFFKPLPENLKDFQSFVHNTFGPIYDTKLLSKELKRIRPKNEKWAGNSLSEIYSYLNDGYAKIHSSSMCIELDDIEEPQNMKWHHAGWDAYYTGYCFLKTIYLIKNNLSKKESSIDQKYTLTELLKCIEYYKNKCYTSKSVSFCIDLEAAEHHINQINLLTIQNKGLFYKALDVQKVKHDLDQICVFDLKLLSKYTALAVIPFINNRIVENINLQYRVENYSQYQYRKKKRYFFTLSLIIFSSAAIIYLKK